MRVQRLGMFGGIVLGALLLLGGCGDSDEGATTTSGTSEGFSLLPDPIVLEVGGSAEVFAQYEHESLNADMDFVRRATVEADCCTVAVDADESRAVVTCESPGIGILTVTAEEDDETVELSASIECRAPAGDTTLSTGVGSGCDVGAFDAIDCSEEFAECEADPSLAGCDDVIAAGCDFGVESPSCEPNPVVALLTLIEQTPATVEFWVFEIDFEQTCEVATEYEGDGNATLGLGDPGVVSAHSGGVPINFRFETFPDGSVSAAVLPGPTNSGETAPREYEIVEVQRISDRKVIITFFETIFTEDVGDGCTQRHVMEIDYPSLSHLPILDAVAAIPVIDVSIADPSVTVTESSIIVEGGLDPAVADAVVIVNGLFSGDYGSVETFDAVLSERDGTWRAEVDRPEGSTADDHNAIRVAANGGDAIGTSGKIGEPNE